jgi:hypothetical protein
VALAAVLIHSYAGALPLGDEAGKCTTVLGAGIGSGNGQLRTQSGENPRDSAFEPEGELRRLPSGEKKPAWWCLKSHRRCPNRPT